MVAHKNVHGKNNDSPVFTVKSVPKFVINAKGRGRAFSEVLCHKTARTSVICFKFVI